MVDDSAEFLKVDDYVNPPWRVANGHRSAAAPGGHDCLGLAAKTQGCRHFRRGGGPANDIYPLAVDRVGGERCGIRADRVSAEFANQSLR